MKSGRVWTLKNTDVTLLNAFFFCSNFAFYCLFLLFLLTICSFRIKIIILQLNFKNQENRMKQNNSNLLYHLVAFITVAIWGTTFVSTKVLMLNGLSPAQIFTLRFSIAYIMMLMVNHNVCDTETERKDLCWRKSVPVSYTHLTLPTIRLV